MQINKVHCFFEQSGTFKNVFKSFGVPAYDYDIMNDFGETDFLNDLFKEIDFAYRGKSSIFDYIEKDDLIFAFFPCTRFDIEILMHLLGNAKHMKDWSDARKIENSRYLMREVASMYDLICKLFLVCYQRGFRLIVENPYRGTAHFLTRYFPVKPAIVDMDRSILGDTFKKPTQFWFVNCSPCNNFEFGEDLRTKKSIKKVQDCNRVERSMIDSEYAKNFIKSFILDIDNV